MDSNRVTLLGRVEVGRQLTKYCLIRTMSSQKDIGRSASANRICPPLSWSVLSHVLSKEQSKDGSNGASDDGRLTIVQCHHYHRPPLSDLYRSSVGILPLLWYHQQNLHSYHCHYQPAQYFTLSHIVRLDSSESGKSPLESGESPVKVCSESGKSPVKVWSRNL